MSELIPVVNEQDEIIGYKERKEITKNDIYRVAGAIIYNQKGEILLAQRGLYKKLNPGKWSASTAGTVEKGETYDENIQKEVPEEIGVTGIKLEFLRKLRIHSETNYFVQIYIGFCNLEKHEFTIEYPQVNDIMWVSEKMFKTLLQDKDYSIGSSFTYIISELKIFDLIQQKLKNNQAL